MLLLRDIHGHRYDDAQQDHEPPEGEEGLLDRACLSIESREIAMIPPELLSPDSTGDSEEERCNHQHQEDLKGRERVRDLCPRAVHKRPPRNCQRDFITNQPRFREAEIRPVCIKNFYTGIHTRDVTSEDNVLQ